MGWSPRGSGRDFEIEQGVAERFAMRVHRQGTRDAAAEGAVVRGTITEHDRAKKTLVFKFKRKKQYKRTIGHRQNYTRVQINEIA